jgi:rhamnopyranosyl-N-acetylglucosaminyl-diphospho-decaprenol beta-1,3/1,4-galactofuranosyltransferase
VSHPTQQDTICAVVVTHNRCELLRECLDAVLGQTRPPDEVLVLDNASTDGTRSLLEGYGDRVDVVRLPRNEGSSGGFHEGIAEAVRRGPGWVWVMDDDTIPAPSALERLLAARRRLDGLPDPVILASRVEWTDGRVHGMNPPFPNLADITTFVEAVDRGLLPVRANTFPSLLVRRDAVERHGPPRKGFWIWSDDMDFTQRILRHEHGYVVPSSVAVHKTAVMHYPWHGGPRFYYAVRNGLFILRGDTLAGHEKVTWSLLCLGQIRRFLAVERWRPGALRIVVRGLRDGLLRPRP